MPSKIPTTKDDEDDYVGYDDDGYDDDDYDDVGYDDDATVIVFCIFSVSYAVSKYILEILHVVLWHSFTTSGWKNRLPEIFYQIFWRGSFL